MPKINENKFYQALEDIFIGAKVEGDSGYVNLLKIKEKYYREILDKFRTEVDSNSVISGNFREEFFDKLYSFFEKYFSESGSVYFVKTAHWQRVYEQVYTDNRDVVLFWKTHMLYYVKSDILFQNLEAEVTDDETGVSYNFYFDTGELEQKQNNEKKELLFEFREVREENNSVDEVKGESKKVYVFDVKYAQNGKKTKTEEIAKKSGVPGEVIKKAIKTFKKQSEVDFFINKNAREFLEEQLDLYLHQILLKDENKFDQKRLDQIKTLKEYAGKIIDFISQFENELVRVWNKPKFALNSNYVITLDKLPEELIEKIAGHENLKTQIKEWQDLGMAEKDFVFEKRGEKHKYLPIDTKYFKDLETEILGIFDNLDEAMDGRLIHSENYQALNTLQKKYKGKAQCIYIDPPFNTGNDFAYVDKFQDSTWLTLMRDRIELGRELLRQDGSFYLHLDYRADHLGRFLMDLIFGNENFLNEIAWQGTTGDTSDKNKKFIKSHDLILFFSKKEDSNLWNDVFQKHDKGGLKPYRFEDEKGKFRWTDVSNPGGGGYFYDLGFGEKQPKNGYRMPKETALKWIKEGILKVEKDTVPSIKRYLNIEGVRCKDVWYDIKSLQPSEKIKDALTQKPERFLKRIIKASSDSGSIIFDFFAGSATTIATAHKLNRKWLGVEMGEHLETVALPRMKTVLFGKISGISKELERENKLKKGGFFKYYSLEQYENTLQKMKYKKDTPSDIFDERNPFGQYVFFADNKFADCVELKKHDIKVDFDKIYAGIDLPETISNLLGLPIKRITSESVILKDKDAKEGEREIKTDPAKMNKQEKQDLIHLLKPLLWWGE